VDSGPGMTPYLRGEAPRRREPWGGVPGILGSTKTSQLRTAGYRGQKESLTVLPRKRIPSSLSRTDPWMTG
jgi:hypothetical protein